MRFIIYEHSLVVYSHLLMTLRRFRQIPDWLDKAALPAWVKEKELS